MFFTANSSGCEHCSAGYFGRLAIFEVIEMSDSLADMILRNEPNHQIEQYIQDHNMHTLRGSAIQALNQGLTSLLEVKRVLNM